MGDAPEPARTWAVVVMDGLDNYLGLIILGGWFLLQAVILPRLGVGT